MLGERWQCERGSLRKISRDLFNSGGQREIGASGIVVVDHVGGFGSADACTLSSI